MAEYLTKKGNKKLVIGVAPWAEAKRLKSAIERAASRKGVTLSKEANIGQLVDAMLEIDSDDAVDAALGVCLARCTYAGSKITDTIFDNIEARGDYYEIITSCIKENLGPLVESLHSVLPPALLLFLMKGKRSESAPE